MKISCRNWAELQSIKILAEEAKEIDDLKWALLGLLDIIEELVEKKAEPEED
jgi:hypothetical protein